MKRLLNTLYVLSEDAYLTRDSENIVVKKGDTEAGRVPLHTLENILCFSYPGASPSLMGACVEKGIGLSFFTPRGRYLASVCGESRGNVLLRKEQYAVSNDQSRSLPIARNIIEAKIHNSKWILERALRDHGLRVDSDKLKNASLLLSERMKEAAVCVSLDSLRGIEGDAASIYFNVFDELILRDKEFFKFNGRSRRPPLDPVNAMLSLFYTVLSRDYASALEGVGLDAYVGFLHADRPGRQSLALDLLEELRSVIVDRFVLSCINNRVVNPSSFVQRESGEYLIAEKARKDLFAAWQERKLVELIHPFLKEKIKWGLVPHVQSLLLTRFLRGDLDGYPPFFWK